MVAAGCNHDLPSASQAKSQAQDQQGRTPPQLLPPIPAPTPTPPKDQGLVGAWKLPTEEKEVISDIITFSKDGSFAEVKKVHLGKFTGISTQTGNYEFDGKNYSAKNYMLKLKGDPAKQKIYDATAFRTNSSTSNGPPVLGTVTWKGKDHAVIDTTRAAYGQYRAVKDRLDLIRQ